MLTSRIWMLLTAMAVSVEVAAADPNIELFSPQGAVKKVRQVTVRFSEAMVPFGDPRLTEPFIIDCPAKGTARWADSRNWIYDFDQDLPAGLRCNFRLKSDVKSLAGTQLAGNTDFAFTTGGPVVRQSLPHEGNSVDEEQVFLIGLDAPADPASILANAYCEVQGIKERMAVRLVDPDTRRQLLAANRGFLDRYVRAWIVSTRSGESREVTTRALIRGSDFEKFLDSKPEDSSVVALACQRRLPNTAQVRLVWGKGIRTTSGVATETDQALAYRVRDEFRAKFHCERVNANADCIPILPMTLQFSAPVPRAQAARVRLLGPGGQAIAPKLGGDDDEKGATLVNAVGFAGPFPERTAFRVQLPDNFKDDAGRPLANNEIFPLTVRTDDYPPLAKFPARFGIIELNAEPALPVTLRNLEARLEMLQIKVAGEERSSLMDKLKKSSEALFARSAEQKGPISGQVLRVWKDAETEVLHWMRQLQGRQEREGYQSLFTEGGAREPARIQLSKPLGERAFEVVGIPLKEPGFYVVELASPRLGAALHDENKPYYVQAGALVTNLAVHFKHGREGSVVWVTTLDHAKPVAEARVEVRDCAGTVHAQGITGVNGIMYITRPLPKEDGLPGCLNNYDRQFFVIARTDGDFSFAFSGWKDGIDLWRFQLPTQEYGGPYLASSVLDRSLFRAGETAHLKHFYRRHTGTGLTQAETARLPGKLVIEHLGSNQKYEQELKWDDQGIADSTWNIPPDARLGTYQISIQHPDSITGRAARYVLHGQELPPKVTGHFRVEAFRVPTMKASVTSPHIPLVNARSAEIDVQVSYLSGGGAGGQTVKLRGLVQPKEMNFPDYEGFQFANGRVQEGLERPGAAHGSQHDFLSDETDDESPSDNAADTATPVNRPLTAQTVTLDSGGAARVRFDHLPAVTMPHTLQAELEYADANGEILTASTRVPLLPAKVIVGLKPDAWAASKDKLRFHALVLNPEGQPHAGAAVKVELLQRKQYSHRKRLVGGFYAYEHYSEIKMLKEACSGVSDSKGLLVCETASPVSGNLIVQARATDSDGKTVYTHRDVWVAGKDEWWFDVTNDDRMDVLPERKRYEPGETATFQVRMPFREATALVTVEREGVIDSFVARLSGKNPVVKVPLKGHYAPNVFVSVLAVRGRVAGVQPTALVDLGKPSFKLGIAEIQVGWKAHELKVEVTPERTSYKVRDKARVRIQARRADGGALPPNAEVALAVVDEGLLELMNNDSWKLLDAMMARRPIEVQTATAQMHVVGKRHFGRKNLPPGGGGGRQVSRELFDTLLLWKARVKLDANGVASVDVPLNDSLTSFRIVAVASAGANLFGSGQTSIRSTQDLMLIAGLPPLMRERDRYAAGVTVRNNTTRPLATRVQAGVRASDVESGAHVVLPALGPVSITLAPGEARTLHWETTVPINARQLEWSFIAESGTARDQLKIKQKVVPAVRVRTVQATLQQLENPLSLPVEIPGDAIAGRGGIKLTLHARLSDELAGVREYMSGYPYSCLEQRVSQAIALRDESRWRAIMNSLPSYLDSDGLAKYFPVMRNGSETLTSYLLIIAEEAGWEIPGDARERMLKGLGGFVQGRVMRHSALPTADLTLRKLSALNALARHQSGIKANLLGSISIDPNLWPTSAVLDWQDILKRSSSLPDREKHLTDVGHILRSRLNFQGTSMSFSTERSDALWWLMCSADGNANRLLLATLEESGWREDIPRLVRGALARQHRGHWNTTVANAWGTLAMEKFSKAFEKVSVNGVTRSSLATSKLEHTWPSQPRGGELLHPWPSGRDTLKVEHAGSGKPWLTIQSLAAIPLKQPFSTGYKITRSVTPLEQKVSGSWSRGDVYRVKLEIDAQSDMTWVVVNDPVPAGSAILGTGLGRDSQLFAHGEKKQGWVWPAFEERTFDSFRAYYEYVPKGRFTLEYTVRLNTSGRFEMPETRVEALYAPEMFGEIPNTALDVRP